MSQLPDPIIINQTVEKIFKQKVDSRSDWRRPHLGSSLIGKDCERALWYTFRFCTDPNFSGRLLRLFETGFQQEARIMADLKSIGCTVYDLDPDTGKQINFSEMGSHFSGSLDAIVLGFPEAPKTWHVVECKTMSTKVFNKLCKEGVKKVKPEHYAQMQTYCRWAGLDRAMYLVVCKETDDIYQERVYYDKTFALQLQDKARRVIFADEPLERASDNAGNFKCRYCEHKPICWEERLPEVSCRTCAHITPIEDETKTSPFEDGVWYCSRHEKKISTVDQKRACSDHIFIPALVPLEVTDADADKGLVTYAGTYVNGPGRMASIDLQKLIDVGGERCSGNSDRSRPFAPREPDMSGVAYETGFIPQ